MEMMCRNDEDSVAAIKGSVSSYVCRYGGDGKRALSLKSKKLSMAVDWTAKNYEIFVKKYLGKNL